MVGVPGFEPGAFRSQSGRATKLRHTPFAADESSPWRGSSRPHYRQHGRYRLLIDHQGKGLWKHLFVPEGPTYRLFDVIVDRREKADLARHHPELVASLRQAWERFDADQLPYPPLPAAENGNAGLPD